MFLFQIKIGGKGMKKSNKRLLYVGFYITFAEVVMNNIEFFMCPKSVILVLAFLLATVEVSAQHPLSGNVALGNTHHVDSMRVSNVNIGLLSNIDTLRGFQFGLTRAGVWKKMTGLNIGVLSSALFGDADGVTIGGLGSNVEGMMHGFQIAGFSNVTNKLHGVQIVGFSNVSFSPMHGIQLAGISNISMGVKKGMQISSAVNVSAGSMRGLQMSAFNYADTLSGTQIGIINSVVSHPRGVQIGIFNYSRDTVAHKIGLVNVNPKTRIDYLLYLCTTSKLNAALRFRNRSTYNIIGVGSHYMGLDSKFSGAVFYRIGQYFQLTPKWSVSGDVGYYHIETFEHNTNDSPERLYSLQAHANVDYQINRYVGAFASLGYGDTRYYKSNQHYRNGLLAQVGISLRYHRSSDIRSPFDNRYIAEEDSLPSYMRFGYRYGSPHPWIAVAEATGINAFVHCFDRFVMNEDFAQVNLHTIHNNFKHGLVWDNDQFSTNLFAHPYHGNLYFNSARSNGLTFWQSAPYALGGSLMWEFCGEIEPPAINDLMATTFGGIAIGEVMHRISNVILNDRSHGFRRFLREAAATIVDPMKGLNRIVSGDAWTVRNDKYLYHDKNEIPLDFSMNVGWRYLADNGALFRGEHNPYVNFFLEYGDALSTDNNHPYDFFSAEATFGLSGNQPLINGLHLLGRIYGKTLYDDDRYNIQLGIFQHFNYYDSKPVKDGTNLTPYRISEAASFGPGFIMSFPKIGALARLEERIFLSAILLGGTKSDYYNVIDRDYNMGSGYSLKTKTFMEFLHFGRFILHTDFYRIYTWKGYENKNLSTVDPLYLNAQGDKGNALLFVLNPIWEFDVKGPLSVCVSGSYFIRHTHYSYHDDVNARTFESRIGLTYHF